MSKLLVRGVLHTIPYLHVRLYGPERNWMAHKYFSACFLCTAIVLYVMVTYFFNLAAIARYWANRSWLRLSKCSIPLDDTHTHHLIWVGVGSLCACARVALGSVNCAWVVIFYSGTPSPRNQLCKWSLMTKH